jgi:hypothetical protein
MVFSSAPSVMAELADLGDTVAAVMGVVDRHEPSDLAP